MNARPDASAASSATATASVPTLSHRLASFAVGFEPVAMPDDLVALAKASILDAIGIAYASLARAPDLVDLCEALGA
jgi:2-methylcitrate dehydratase PrpD